MTDRVIPPVTILGGGVAGLAVAHYARARGVPFALLEGAPHLGGLCRTLWRDGFGFDVGAHRLHDKDEEVTRDLLALLQPHVHRTDLGSHIWHRGTLVSFPPTAWNLMATVGPSTLARSALGAFAARRRATAEPEDFEQAAIRSYGRPVADLFLLNYSRKLWGVPCAQLSPRVSGGRLRGLSARGALREFVFAGDRRPQHVDGQFYYPSRGIGALVDALVASCGREALRTNCRVEQVHHADGRVTGLTLASGEHLPVSHLVSTLPLNRFVRMLSPALADVDHDDAVQLRFRGLRLVMLHLARARVTSSATVYFPDDTLPFTRVSEPRNRSPFMAPEGRTSLMVEIPCDAGDDRWNRDDRSTIDDVTRHLIEIGWITAADVIEGWSLRVADAYPVIDIHAERVAQRLRVRLSAFTNLALAGRAARFEYAWLHDLMRGGRDLAGTIAASCRGSGAAPCR